MEKIKYSIKEIRDFIDNVFNEEELTDFYYYLERSDYEKFNSSDGKKAKIRYIIDVFRREDDISKLLDLISEEREIPYEKFTSISNGKGDEGNKKNKKERNSEIEDLSPEILYSLKRTLDESIDDLIPLLESFKIHQKTGILPPVLPTQLIIGSGDKHDLEAHHSFACILDNLIDDNENSLLIGSPFLRYWFDGTKNPRMAKLLEKSNHTVIKVALFSQEESRLNDDEYKQITKQMEQFSSSFPSRFYYRITDEYSELSYIIYDIKHPEIRTNGQRWQKAIVGYQKTNYDERPFIELNYEKEKIEPFIRVLKDNHESLFKETG